ncbi:MAG: hypothetical protein ABI358_02360 [Ginsengibacter sp.]
MKNSLVLITLISLTVISFSCQKPFNDPNGPPNTISYDVNAKIFIDSSGITDTAQKTAVNNFCIQLKDSSLWTKFIAIYPMVGGSANTTKWNLKDPRDLDAAYRLTFYGSPVFAPTGILFPSVNEFADTHLADSAIGVTTDAAISYYSRTQNTISGYDMGCSDGFKPYNELSIYSNSADNSEWFGFSQQIFSPSTTGLFMLSSSVSDVTRYRNGTIVSTKGAPPLTYYTNLTFFLGKSRISSHSGQKECAFATIGNGLNDAEAQTFYNIVQNFERALNREM